MKVVGDDGVRFNQSGVEFFFAGFEVAGGYDKASHVKLLTTANG